MISVGRLVHIMGLVARARKVLDEVEENAMHYPEEGCNSELIHKAISLLAEADVHARLIDEPPDPTGASCFPC
jgi:hypothetical protein